MEKNTVEKEEGDDDVTATDLESKIGRLQASVDEIKKAPSANKAGLTLEVKSLLEDILTGVQKNFEQHFPKIIGM